MKMRMGGKMTAKVGAVRKLGRYLGWNALIRRQRCSVQRKQVRREAYNDAGNKLGIAASIS